ncbi:MAG: hypothetical protein PHO14_02550 [Kiritimatiellae bacterium]|jgi:predicted small lipoprotein YifL|nr:hypothetical protein [Kiritimatiellia bacterium]MDD4341095.1 hypothetical protein [Kiritimatiellia bacterium]MDY0148538.1 hypothetical protein [Kiritimatiellia bacterium]
MNTTKHAFWKYLVAVSCLALAGCSQPQPEPAPAPPAERMADDSVAPTNTDDQEQAMIEAFEEQQFEDAPVSIEW